VFVQPEAKDNSSYYCDVALDDGLTSWILLNLYCIKGALALFVLVSGYVC